MLNVRDHADSKRFPSGCVGPGSTKRVKLRKQLRVAGSPDSEQPFDPLCHFAIPVEFQDDPDSLFIPEGFSEGRPQEQQVHSEKQGLSEKEALIQHPYRENGVLCSEEQSLRKGPARSEESTRPAGVALPELSKQTEAACEMAERPKAKNLDGGSSVATATPSIEPTTTHVADISTQAGSVSEPELQAQIPTSVSGGIAARLANIRAAARHRSLQPTVNASGTTSSTLGDSQVATSSRTVGCANQPIVGPQSTSARLKAKRDEIARMHAKRADLIKAHNAKQQAAEKAQAERDAAEEKELEALQRELDAERELLEAEKERGRQLDELLARLGQGSPPKKANGEHRTGTK